MATAFTFPGQGAQQVGMLERLPDSASARALLAQAEALLQRPLAELHSARALADTRNVQLALLISGVIWGEHLMQAGLQPDYVLGLSIGAYPAAVVAGCLGFEDALRLVTLRGDLMQQAFPAGYGMLALLNVDLAQVESAVAAQQAQGLPVYLANLNAEHQFVLAGRVDLLEQTAERIRAQGRCTSRRLEVAVPSHCALLATQAEEMAAALARIRLQPPRCAYVSAARARVLRQPEQIRADLAHNLACQVHWHDSSRLLAERGVQTVVEMPPGASLTGLFRRVLPQGRCLALAETPLGNLVPAAALKN